MEYALFTQNNKVVEIKNVDDLTQEKLSELQSLGWKEVVDVEKPTYNEEIEYIHRYINIEEDGSYKNVYVVMTDREKAINKISTLKQQLADTDYKVVKNMEYQMAMMTSTEPNQVILDLYNPQELHNERQALRDKINELEQLLKGE